MPIAEGRTLPFAGPETVDTQVLQPVHDTFPEQQIVTDTDDVSAVLPYSVLPDFA